MANTLQSIPAENLPQYDELYVISDLHLGGRSGFQIFNSSKELVQLIHHLRSSLGTGKKTALIINGDFVDFLAESPAMHFDPVNAVDKLNRIALEDPAFSPIFEALKKFVSTKNRFLVINLGNHDLELALPWVREHLLKLLAGDNEAARGRISLAFDGAGYLSKVGNAKVLCVHGNEVDDWNLTDHEMIRRIGRDMVQGRPVDNWIPNAGTQLVIDVMNDVKKHYPFVDLLKPEMPAVIPTLLALGPEHYNKVREISVTAGRLVWDKLRRATGFLGKEEKAELMAMELSISPATRPEVGLVAGKSSYNNERKNLAEALLLETEQRLSRNEQPISLVAGDQQEEYLGKMGAFWKYINGANTSEVLREALENLQQDRSFDVSFEDETFNSLDEKIGGEIDYLIAGHTHLERAIKRKKGRGWYFNSGTWIRLIKLEEEVLKDKDKFVKVFNNFKAGSMDALDLHPGLVKRNLTVVVISAEVSGTTGELKHVRIEPDEEILAPVSGSLFTKK